MEALNKKFVHRSGIRPRMVARRLRGSGTTAAHFTAPQSLGSLGGLGLVSWVFMMDYPLVN